MNEMSTYRGTLEGKGLKIGIAVSRFNRRVTAPLLDGALEKFRRLGVAEEDIDVVWVPGSFELPQTIRALAQTGRYHGLLPLGCIIRGETPHYEYLAQSVSRELGRLSVQEKTPIAFGLLTCDTPEQALARAGLKANKGAEAAESLIELIRLRRQVEQGQGQAGR